MREQVQNINKQNFRQIALNLTLPEIGQICQVNKEISKLCEDDTFWKLYLQKYFLVDANIKNRTYKETVQQCYDLIAEFDTSNIYITAKLLTHFLHVKKPVLNAFIDNHTFTEYPMLYSYYVYSNLLPNIKYYTVKGDNMISSNSNDITGSYNDNDILNSFNSDELDIFKYTLKFVETPTYYLTIRGPVQIPFDIDRLDAILYDKNLRSHINIRNYLDALIKIFNSYIKIIAIKYLDKN